MKNNIISTLIAIAVIGVLVWYLGVRDHGPSDGTQILSFEDCVDAGYPVQESSPRRCTTPDGRTYAEERQTATITYTNATADDITVDTPTPGAVTGKSFRVSGKARGWYFEGSFPVRVLDANGVELAAVPAQAQGEWMTSDPVPFIADITVPESYIGPATIVLKKDNPSGMPENDASISYPITIEY